MKRWINLLLLAVLIGAICMAFFTHLPKDHYHVTKIVDGDTVHMKDTTGKDLKVRLLHIDAPETSQEYGKDSKEALNHKLLDAVVTLDETKPDPRYPERILAVIYLDGRNINLEMLHDGWAWHYAQFSHVVQYEKAEKQAKSLKLGLWQGKKPIPPWEYRKQKMLERLQKSS